MTYKFFCQGVWYVSPDQLSDNGVTETVKDVEFAEPCCCTQSAERLGYCVRAFIVVVRASRDQEGVRCIVAESVNSGQQAWVDRYYTLARLAFATREVKAPYTINGDHAVFGEAT